MRLLSVLCFAVALPLTAQPNSDLHKLFRDYYEMTLRESPESATAAGRRDYNDKWTDWSLKALAEEKQHRQDYLKRLDAFRNAKLDTQDRLSFELLEYELRTSLEELNRLRNYEVVNHFFGPQLQIFSTLALAPAQTVKDFEDRIARIRAIPTLVDGMIEAAEDARAKGMIPPKVVIDRLIGQLDTQRKSTPEQSPLLAAFQKMPASISAADQQRLRQSASQAYTQAFQPAWQRYRSYVADSYLPKARTSLAIADLPDGKAHYAFLVRDRTTTDLTPEQIHETGKREVERITGEMAAIRKEVGFTGTPEEFNDKVLNAPNMRFKTEAEILVHGRDIAKRIDPELPRLFRRLPRTPYGVRAIPADRARSMAPYYEPPALDGSRAGNFYLRTADPETQSRCCMEALILHEAVPGHHLQVAIARELDGIPDFRKSTFHTAYVEGWGLYAESLGSDLNMYENPNERYGRLQSELMRALRLVTDTGLHHYGWTREQAIAMMSKSKGGWINDEVVSSEVDRYIAIPGQALAYKVGELKIKELRARAEKQLGSKFDVREFHDVILRNGSLPLTVLEREVDRWLASARVSASR
jgi:uncharacterized protein (DUF885 family)